MLNLPIILGDHAPILISSEGKLVRPRQSFKFENWWPMEKYFQSFAKNNWISSSLTSFAAKSSSLAGSLKVWCKKKKPLQQELAELESRIKDLQQLPLHQQDHVLESTLTNRYELTLSKLNQFYRQRSKKSWAVKGDRNTKFFHQAVLKRRKRNTICSIKDEHDNIHFKPEAMMQTFVNYFRHIFSSPNTYAGRPFSSPIWTNDNNDPTYSIPDKTELLRILKDMKLNASPGPDGFNGLFFKKCWHIICEEFYELARGSMRVLLVLGILIILT